MKYCCYLHSSFPWTGPRSIPHLFFFVFFCSFVVRFCSARGARKSSSLRSTEEWQNANLTAKRGCTMVRHIKSSSGPYNCVRMQRIKVIVAWFWGCCDCSNQSSPKWQPSHEGRSICSVKVKLLCSAATFWFEPGMLLLSNKVNKQTTNCLKTSSYRQRNSACQRFIQATHLLG